MMHSKSSGAIPPKYNRFLGITRRDNKMILDSFRPNSPFSGNKIGAFKSPYDVAFRVNKSECAPILPDILDDMPLV